MLRITSEAKPGAARIKLEGKVAGPWVDELERAWYAAAEGRQAKEIVVDLSDVTFIDTEGRKLLAWICQQGAGFQACGCMMRSVVEQIRRDCAGLQAQSGCAPESQS